MRAFSLPVWPLQKLFQQPLQQPEISTQHVDGDSAMPVEAGPTKTAPAPSSTSKAKRRETFRLERIENSLTVERKSKSERATSLDIGRATSRNGIVAAKY